MCVCVSSLLNVESKILVLFVKHKNAKKKKKKKEKMDLTQHDVWFG